MRHSRPAAELAEAGQTPVAVAVNDQLRLLPGVVDALRPDSPHGIRRLHGLGLETVLATGDTWEAAATTARAPASAPSAPGCCHRTRRRSSCNCGASADRSPWSATASRRRRAVMLARATRTIIRQNLGSAFGYNLIPVPLAAAGVLPPVLAAAMAASSVTVVGNALRLRRFGKTGAGRRPTAVA